MTLGVIRRMRQNSTARARGRASGLLALPIAFACLALPLSSAWGLSPGISDSPTRRLQLGFGGGGWTNPATGGPGEVGVPVSGRVQLTLGGSRSLKVTALSFLGKRAAPRVTSGIEPLGLVGPSTLSGPGTPYSLVEQPRDRASDDEGSLYRVDYSSGPLALRANLVDVGARFSHLSSQPDQSSEEDVKLLQEAAGTRNLELDAELKLARGASLTSRHTALRNDKPGDKKQGLTTTDTSHVFSLALGASSQLQASVKDHEETWDQTQGKPTRQERSNSVELKTSFGSGGRSGLRMAFTTNGKTEEEKEKSEAVREVHLNLAPTSRLQLTADHVTKTPDEGPEQRTQAVGAVMQLAPATQLAASVTTLTSDQGDWQRESVFKLNTNLGGGATSGQLAAEEKVVRALAEGASRQFRTYELTGGLGKGPARANLRASLKEERGEGPAGELKRATALHADRAFGPRLNLTADREVQVGGTNREFATGVKSAYAVAAQLDPRTKLNASLNTFDREQDDRRWSRDLVLEHQRRGFQVRSQHQLWREGEQDRTADQHFLDVPRGRLAEWAQDLTHGHEFGDARDYLTPKEPDWVDMPFAGLRLWTKQRRGGADAGVDSVGWAHRTMVGGRFHLQVACQENPEATDGDNKGRPMAVRRQMAELGGLLRQGLVAHGRYLGEDNTSGDLYQKRGLALGLRGRLSSLEEVEVSVSRETEDWADRSRRRHSVTLMYGLKVNDEHEVSVKAGYAWSDEDPAGDRSREYRVGLGYSKPI